MALSPVINTVAALEVDPPGSEEGGKTSIPVSMGGGCDDDDDGGWSSSELPSSSEEAVLAAEENAIGKSIIAIHLAIDNGSSVPVPVPTHVRSHSGGKNFAIADEAITNLQNNGSGTSSTSTLCMLLLGGAPVEMDTIRLPRMYIAPLTAAARQNPCAISPVPP